MSDFDQQLSHGGASGPDWQTRLFDAWVGAMLRHRALVLVTTLLVTAGFGYVAQGLPIFTALRDMLPDDSRDMREYLEARERFGGDETVYVALQRDDHFTPDGLAKLARLTARLDEHPLVERAISFTTADWIRTAADDPAALRIDPFVPIDPDAAAALSPQRVAAIRTAVLGDPLVAGSLISDDGRLALVAVKLVPSDPAWLEWDETRAYVEARLAQAPDGRVSLDAPGGKVRGLEVAKQLVAEEFGTVAVELGYAADGVHITGFPAVLGSLLTEAQRTLRIFLPLTALVIGLVLFVILRRMSDVVLPMVCVIPAIIWAVGLGGLIFGRLSIITSVSPIMVLVVGMSDVVHLVTQFRHELARGRAREMAIRVAFREVGAACALTSLTTLIGFGSMVFLPLPHSRELGVFAGLGVVCAFVLAFVLTPVLLSFTRSTPDATASGPHGRMTDLLDALARWLRPRPKVIVAGGLVFTVATLAAVSQIQVENSLSRKLPTDHPLRVAARVVTAAFGGTGEIEMMIDTGRDDGVQSPEFLAGLWRLQRAIDAYDKVAETRSIGDILGRMHTLLAPERARETPVPDTGPMIAQYLLLFEMTGGSDLSFWIDGGRRHARMTARMPDLTAEEAIQFAAEFDALAAKLLPPTVAARCNGLGLMAARAGPVIMATSLKGLATAVVLIALLMTLLFRSVRVGVISIVPNLLPVAFGIVVVWLALPQVDADAMIYLTICIGISVDDTIHFLSRYRIERRRGRDRPDAVAATLRETGHGILRTSIILCAGFAVPGASQFFGLKLAGYMLPATLFSAVLLDLTMVPALAQLGLLEAKRSS